MTTIHTYNSLSILKKAVLQMSLFSIMKGKDSWPDPDKHASSTQSLDLITVPEVLLISEIAGYVENVIESEHFLASGVTYKSLSLWAKVMSNPGKYDAHASYSSTTHGSSTPGGGGNDGGDKKMLSFKIDLFTGGTLSGGVYIRNILSVFKFNTVLLFLTDVGYYRQNLPWSSAFASCIRTSIVDSSILSFLARILGKEENCAVCFWHYQNQNRLSCHFAIL